ncbi:MAG TPA: hypothetical protein VF251_15000, partial [Pyrinomonadaceae bacterium]
STEKEELNMKSQIQRGVKIGVVVLLLGISAYAAVTVVLAFGTIDNSQLFSTARRGYRENANDRTPRVTPVALSPWIRLQRCEEWHTDG